MLNLIAIASLHILKNYQNKNWNYTIIVSPWLKIGSTNILSKKCKKTISTCKTVAFHALTMPRYFRGFFFLTVFYRKNTHESGRCAYVHYVREKNKFQEYFFNISLSRAYGNEKKVRRRRYNRTRSHFISSYFRSVNTHTARM